MDQGHERGVPSMDFRIRRADGAEVWLAQETTRVRGPDGDPLGLRLSLREVTDRVAAQTALREANEGLEQRVRERTAELERANADLRREIRRGEKARKSLEESRERIRNLSAYLQDRVEEERRRISREIHDELGQTLTAVGMGLARLEQRPPADEAASRSQVAGLRELAANALDTVRPSPGTAAGHPDDLGLCEAASAHTRSFAESTGIEVDLEAPPVSPNLDPEQTTALYRVLQEALTNVARHAGATRVRVRLAASRRALRLTVADNGRGAPESDLCDPGLTASWHARTHALFRRRGACRQRAGTRTTVTAVLPLGPGGEHDAAPIAPPQPVPLAVLVVDDHAVVRRGVMDIIADMPRPVAFLEAETSAQALALLKGHPCGLVILDLSLPDESGFETLAGIRRMHPELPVIVSSMHVEAEYARRALALGADGYLGKTPAPGELALAINLVMAGGTYVSRGWPGN
jgi:signal transduction histidine kinase/CheY-like chemotaxis protein